MELHGDVKKISRSRNTWRSDDIASRWAALRSQQILLVN